MHVRDLKYLIAFALPLSGILALYLQGPWSWASVVLGFAIIPILELWTPSSTDNTPPLEEEPRSKQRFFDLLLYSNAPFLFGIVLTYLYTIQNGLLSTAEMAGLTLSVGIIVGANGINVAHELGHREKKTEQWLAQWMLLPALYQHFFIEHNRGHHKNVATLKDPSSARYGESLYAFWIRSVSGAWMGAWRLEADRLSKENKSVFSLNNQMLRFQFWQIAYLVSIAFFIGTPALIGAIGIAAVGFLLLESVNYIEHYGLQRRQLESGRPEPVLPIHSWNSDHELGRIFLYELTRHSDHHFKATRKYQILRHMDESPQLPFGYPTSLLLAFLPPIWFRIMNPRAGAAREKIGLAVS